MKKCLFTVLLAATVGTMTWAQSTLRLINNTSKSIVAAYAIHEGDDGWTTRGWYLIEPYKDRDLNLGNYEGKVYIHGHNSGGFWGNDIYLCTGGKNAFAVRNADEIRCEYTQRFSESRITKGATKRWTFNP